MFLLPSSPGRAKKGKTPSAAVVGAIFAVVMFLSIVVPPALALSDRPSLIVNIPNLQLSSVKVQGDIDQGGPSGVDIGLPWIGEYVQAIYKYAVGLAIFLAGIMAVVGGFQYVTAGGDSGKVGAAKERITNAVAGMVITLGAYLLLYTVNPNLVQTQRVNVQRVPTDYYYFEKHGTGDPVTGTDAIKQTMSQDIPGTPGGVKIVAPDGSPVDSGATGGGGSPPPDSGNTNAPAAPTGPQPGGPGIVDVSDIKWEEDLGGPGNLNKYCTPKKEAEKATTYDQKIQLLVKAVKGFISVCIDHRKCAYAQGGSTILPNGPATGMTLPNFALPKILSASPDGAQWLAGNHPTCIDMWTKAKGSQYCKDNPDGPYCKQSAAFQVNASAECRAAVNEAFNATYMKAVNEGKFFAGDCGTTVRAILRCSGVKFDDIPYEDAYLPGGKKVKTPYLSSKSVTTNADNPRMIISAFMKEDMDAEASKKGGMKFGDLVYMCCGGAPGDYSAHWMLYIGGRDDVPYNFIEMGGSPPRSGEGKGGGVVVPGWGSTGGVDVKGRSYTVASIVKNATQPHPPTWCKAGTKGCPATEPGKTNPNTGLVFVWRPFPAE